MVQDPSAAAGRTIGAERQGVIFTCHQFPQYIRNPAPEALFQAFFWGKQFLLESACNKIVNKAVTIPEVLTHF